MTKTFHLRHQDTPLPPKLQHLPGRTAAAAATAPVVLPTALVATPNARRIAVAAAAAGVARGGALSTRSPRQLGRDGALACLQGSDASAKVRDQLGEEGGRKEGGGRGLLGGERHGESRGPWPMVHK